MQNQSRATTPSGQAPQPTTARSRWLLVAVALCGAMAGASIVEALAALTSHSSAPISPDHLIAAPLVLAGAICGGLLAAVLVSKDQTAASGQNDAGRLVMSADAMPGEPMLWQPAPSVSVAARARFEEFATPSGASAVHARRIRRAIRQHTYGHHHVHGAGARTAIRH